MRENPAEPQALPLTLLLGRMTTHWGSDETIGILLRL